MGYNLTVKSQVTIPKVIRAHLKIAPGQSVDYEPLPDGSVRMFAVRQPNAENPFLKYIGTGVSGLTTEEILRETRGEDAMR